MEEGFSIENIKIKNKLVLAPMAGITDVAFRLLCREQGAGLCYSEMINTEAISRNNKSSIRLSKSSPRDKPLGIQLFGARISSMKKAGTILAKNNDFDFFDLNCGCPDEKILRQGAGAALLQRPKRAGELIQALKETGFPVTAKIRISNNILQSIKFCKQLEAAGVSAITVHAKTVEQAYRGQANFVAVKRIAKAVEIPVIANGNIQTMRDVEKTCASTKASAVMIGRGAIGNPGIFAQVQDKEGATPLESLFKYLELCKKFDTGSFGRKKTMAIRFLVKAKKKQVVFQMQKAKTEEELLSVIQGLR
tara:strand:- start:2991 stop:3911 length:921 start_codon:yes stop_codon:yes gene_type:complete